MDLYEKTVNKNYVYKGKIIKVRRDDAMLPNGNTAVREVVEHTGGVAILATDDGCVYMVEQFRVRQRIEPLLVMETKPGYALESLHIYVAECLSKGKSKLDPDEFLNVKKIKLSEIRKLIETNVIKDAKTVIALLYYFNYLCKE